MFVDALIADFSLDPKQAECSHQSLCKVSIGGNNSRRHTIPFADDDTIGKLIPMIDCTSTCWTAYQWEIALLAEIQFNLPLNALEASQRNRWLRPTEDAQSRGNLPFEMVDENSLVDSHIECGIQDASIDKTICSCLHDSSQPHGRA